MPTAAEGYPRMRLHCLAGAGTTEDPANRQHFCPIQHGLRGLHVRRVAVLPRMYHDCAGERVRVLAR